MGWSSVNIMHAKSITVITEDITMISDHAE